VVLEAMVQLEKGFGYAQSGTFLDKGFIGHLA
jgi:hypothetical protein